MQDRISLRALWVLAFALSALISVVNAFAADVLIRSCDAPTATGCVTASAWVRPSNAVNIQVMRDGAPFVRVSDVLPTERIAACYDPLMAEGSTAKCTVNVPNRSDLWQLKSAVFVVASGGSLQLTVDAANPRWDSQAPIDANLLPDLYVRLYGAEQGQPKVLLDAAPWATSLKFRRESGSAAVFCFAATLALDTTGDKQPDQESSQTGEWCGSFTSPPPVLHLLAPNSITGQSPAP